MAYGFEQKQPDWSIVQQLWILEQVNGGKTQSEIHQALTAEQSDARPAEVERWEGTFSAFKKRLQRLTRNGIDPAIDTDTGQKCEFDLATSRGRYDYWVWLAGTTPNQSTRVSALQMIEKLSPQVHDGIALSREEEFALGKKIFGDITLLMEIANAQIVYLLEQGDDQQAIDALAGLIINNPDIAQAVVQTVINSLPGVIKIEESNEKRIERILLEIQSLTPEEQTRIVKLAEDVDRNDGLLPKGGCR